MVIVLVVSLSSMAFRHVDPELFDALFSDLPVDHALGMCDRKDNSWR